MGLRNSLNWSDTALLGQQEALARLAEPGIRQLNENRRREALRLRELWRSLAPRCCVRLTEQASRRLYGEIVCRPSGVVPIDGILERVEGEHGLIRIFWVYRDITARGGNKPICELVRAHRSEIAASQPEGISVWDARDIGRGAVARAERLEQPSPTQPSNYWSEL
ncbi:hypothetical protein FQK07_14915 [Synechococcus sp. BSF8S]|uniref:hypothetical protein n=1 Tax=Synechococcales TaxID=1890424 RepID=UPI00162A68FF|nr:MULTISPECIES: hypothetical protein [unclassified Synechococcus]MBC1262512.1 hypothetical protein [Synechococcus sp. BSF8S]MBC1263665.1 hypothetical protein [Synechococcus sp. BSA11S]